MLFWLQQKIKKFRFDPFRCAASIVIAGAAGFGAGGIGAGTLGSWLMSWSAIANGGGGLLGAGGLTSFAASAAGQALIAAGSLIPIFETDEEHEEDD